MVTSAALKKVYHVNIHLFGGLYWRLILEVTNADAEVTIALSLVWDLKSVYHVRINVYHIGHLNHLQRSQFFALCP